MAVTSRLAWILPLALTGTAAAGGVLYVDDDAPPGGDGQSWATAYRYLQDALTAAGDEGGNVTEIRVAQGLYLPDRDEAGPGGTGERPATFQLVDGLMHVGGYAGVGAPDPDARDAALHVTILSGDLAGDDGPAFANRQENSHHVVTAASAGPKTVLDGFVVSGGNADLYPESRGGGLRILASTLTVSNCAIVDNQGTVGGAVVSKGGGHPVLVGCTLSGNLSGGLGGAVNVIFNDGITLIGCTLADNAADSNGGAVHANGDQVVLTNCLFTNNTSGLIGGAVWNGASSPVVTGCTFIGNTAARRAGALGAGFVIDAVIADCAFIGNTAPDLGGALSIAGTGTVSGCTFTGNSCDMLGGAVYNTRGELAWADCSFTGNTAFLGGAIYTISWTDLPNTDTFKNVTMEANSATLGGALYLEGTHTAPVYSGGAFRLNEALLGGAMYSEAAAPTVDGVLIESNAATLDGGGLYNEGGQVTVSGCTCSGNEAGTDGGAVYTIAGSLSAAACVFTDNVAWDVGGGIHNRQSALTLTACTFEGNWSDSRGGALANHLDSSASITACHFADNWPEGGAIYNDGSHPAITACTFVEHGFPFAYGGAILNENGSHPVIDRCMFAGNGDYGNGVFGGAIANFDSSPTVTNSVFARNWAALGGAIYNWDSSPTVINCTFVDNEGSSIATESGSPTVHNSIFWYEDLQPVGGPGIVTHSIVQHGHAGDGNMDVDPEFVDPDGPDDNTRTWQDNDYRLRTGSPAADAGDNTVVPGGAAIDCDGNPRFIDDPCAPDLGAGEPPIVDMGAIERQGCCTDVTGDGVTGVSDLLALLAAWGPCACAADLDGDGVVGAADLLTLLAVWGACP